MKKTIFRGSGVAIVTPMNEDFSVNYEEFERLIEFQISNGTDAIIVCGTTGESATMNSEEYSEIIKFTVEKVNGRVPVIAGSGSNNTAIALEHSLVAQKLGADALLIVTPYYNKSSQQGLINHYTYIADRVNIPIILYNVPSRTGCNIKPETYAKLAKHPNIVAIKEASGDISAVAQTMALCGNELAVYSGCDDQIVPIMSLGGLGVISVFADICPKESHELTQKALEGDFESAGKMQLHYLELMNVLFSDVNPIPVKAALNLMGYDCGYCRMPLAPMSESGINNLKEVLKKYGLIG